MYRYIPKSNGSKVMSFTTPDGTVTLTEFPTDITENQVKYLTDNYPEFVRCVNLKIIECISQADKTPPASLSTKRKI